MGQVNQAEVRFDAARRQNYNLNAKGQPVYHAVPAGFQMSAAGVLELAPDATVAQVEGFGVQDPCGPAQVAAYQAALVRAFEHAAGLPVTDAVGPPYSLGPVAGAGNPAPNPPAAVGPLAPNPLLPRTDGGSREPGGSPAVIAAPVAGIGPPYSLGPVAGIGPLAPNPLLPRTDGGSREPRGTPSFAGVTPVTPETVRRIAVGDGGGGTEQG